MAFSKKLFVYFCRLTLKKNIKGATNRHPTSIIKYIQGGSSALTDEMLCHLEVYIRSKVHYLQRVLGWLGDGLGIG